jgi:tetratricopeptide (TPR) repeat protein
MKMTTRFLLTCASLALCALPALANGTFSRVDQTPQDPCSVEGKAAAYAELYPLLKTDQAKAYELAKKYVACPADTGTDQTPEQKAAEAARVDFLKKFIALYEKAHRKDLLTIAINKKDFNEAFELARQVFVDDPAYMKGYLKVTNLGYAASLAQGNPNAALAPDTIAYAKKSLQMIESGTASDSWDPFDSKDDALGWLNYIVGTLTREKSPAEAIPYFIKAATFEGKPKKLPHTYYYLGDAYEHGPYAKQYADYTAKYKDQNETPESKLALENINQVVDRMIDAYARAVALAGSDPNVAPVKTLAMNGATDWYKFRNKDTIVGLDQLIAGILSKPLPPEPTPITTLPASAATPSPTPASSPAATPTPVKPPASSSTTRATTSPSRP